MSMSFHDDFMLQDQASGERSQDQWSSGLQYYVLFYSHDCPANSIVHLSDNHLDESEEQEGNSRL